LAAARSATLLLRSRVVVHGRFACRHWIMVGLTSMSFGAPFLPTPVDPR
jgi:hypothetical protein